MFERRRVDINCLQEVRYSGQGNRVYGGEEKYTIRGEQKWSRDNGKRRPSRGNLS